MTKRKPTGQRIREARKAAGLSMTAVAEQAGISQPYLHEMEAGKKNPFAVAARRQAEADKLLARIAGAVGVDVASLLGK